jgi:hypothetical protein
VTYFQNIRELEIQASFNIKLLEGNRYSIHKIDVPQYSLSESSVGIIVFEKYRNVTLKWLRRSVRENKHLAGKLKE